MTTKGNVMSNQQENSNTKYFLIFKDKNSNVVIMSEADLNKVYELITKHSMPQGTYRIIKGEQVV